MTEYKGDRSAGLFFSGCKSVLAALEVCSNMVLQSYLGPQSRGPTFEYRTSLEQDREFRGQKGL
jgi:hypothetical protein